MNIPNTRCTSPAGQQNLRRFRQYLDDFFVTAQHFSQNCPPNCIFYVNTMKSSKFYIFWIDFMGGLSYNIIVSIVGNAGCASPEF